MCLTFPEVGIECRVVSFEDTKWAFMDIVVSFTFRGRMRQVVRFLDAFLLFSFVVVVIFITRMQ